MLLSEESTITEVILGSILKHYCLEELTGENHTQPHSSRYVKMGFPYSKTS